MRVCDDCGASAGHDTACGQCGAPAPPAAWPPVAEPRNSVPPTRSWPDVAPAPATAPAALAPAPTAPPRKRTSALVAVVVVVLVIAGAVVAFVATRGDDDDAATPPAVANVTYRSQDGVVSVRMPAPPNVTPLPPPLNGAIAAAIQPTYDRLFLEVHAGPVPASQVRSTLRSHVSLAIGIAGATLGTVADMTFLGYPAVRGTASSNGDPVKFLAFAVAGSEYALVVHSRHFAADQMKFFEDSVRIARR